MRSDQVLVTVDPGATTGWAVFLGGTLTACGYISSEKALEACPWYQYLPNSMYVVEMPRMYKSEKEKNPQSILRNAALGGRYLGWGDRIAAEVYELTPPSKWKGSIGKPPTGKQYIIEHRLLKRLSATEKALLQKTWSAKAKQLNHNVVDAVAMGKWWLEQERVKKLLEKKVGL